MRAANTNTTPEPSTEPEQDSTFHKHHKGSAAGAGVSLAQVREVLMGEGNQPGIMVG